MVQIRHFDAIEFQRALKLRHPAHPVKRTHRVSSGPEAPHTFWVLGNISDQPPAEHQKHVYLTRFKLTFELHQIHIRTLACQKSVATLKDSVIFADASQNRSAVSIRGATGYHRKDDCFFKSVPVWSLDKCVDNLVENPVTTAPHYYLEFSSLDLGYHFCRMTRSFCLYQSKIDVSVLQHLLGLLQVSYCCTLTAKWIQKQQNFSLGRLFRKKLFLRRERVNVLLVD